jgi:hypothetical protein
VLVSAAVVSLRVEVRCGKDCGECGAGRWRRFELGLLLLPPSVLLGLLRPCLRHAESKCALMAAASTLCPQTGQLTAANACRNDAAAGCDILLPDQPLQPQQ